MRNLLIRERGRLLLTVRQIVRRILVGRNKSRRLGHSRTNLWRRQNRIKERIGIVDIGRVIGDVVRVNKAIGPLARNGHCQREAVVDKGRCRTIPAMPQRDILIDEHLLNFRTTVIVLANMLLLGNQELLGLFNNRRRLDWII